MLVAVQVHRALAGRVLRGDVSALHFHSAGLKLY